MANRNSSFKFREVHPDHVDCVFKKLKNSKAYGMDEIDIFAVKLVRTEVVPTLGGIGTIVPGLFFKAKAGNILRNWG